MAQQQAKATGKPISSAPSNAFNKEIEPARQPVVSKPAPAPALAQPKGPAPDLIDFFESIEQNQQPMAQSSFSPQPQFQAGIPQTQQYQQAPMPQQSFNPFLQQQQPFQSQALPVPQPLQTDFTGAGFGGYGPQPPQQQVQSPGGFSFGGQLPSIPQNGIPNFQSQALPTTQSPPQLQPQQTSTNPFRQSTINTGSTQFSPVSPPAPVRSSTNPFAKSNTGGFGSNGQNGGVANDQTFSPVQISPQQTFPANPSFLSSPPALQPQRTGTNPFAKNRPVTPGAQVSTNVTGSTNPFRQSAFVNQQTGQGWQHSSQGTFSGFDVNNVETQPVFPRPGAN
jgi:phosphatidylinositol-binding clathrin assembly protein